MIDIEELFCEDSVVVLDSVPSRKTALRRVAELIADQCENLEYRDVFFALEEREQQASTVLDDLPIAIPHCRLSGCTKMTAVLLKTTDESGIDFGGQTVRVIFGLCIPESATREALEILRSFVQVVGNPRRREQLLVAESSHEVFRNLSEGLVEAVSA